MPLKSENLKSGETTREELMLGKINHLGTFWDQFCHNAYLYRCRSRQTLWTNSHKKITRNAFVRPLVLPEDLLRKKERKKSCSTPLKISHINKLKQWDKRAVAEPK